MNILFLCWLSGAAAFYFLFEQGGGFEVYASMNPEAPRSALFIGLAVGFVLWPLSMILALLEGDQ